MKNKTLSLETGLLIGLSIAVGALFISLLLSHPEKSKAVAGQLTAKVATSSTVVVTGGTNAVTMFATSTSGCVARVITTNAEPIRFALADITGFTLSSAIGHTQAASTTVIYDGSLLGCGKWQVLNAGPSGNTATFQVSETY